MDNESISDRCLICYSSIPAASARAAKRKFKHASVLYRQLDNIFILKELLEIPSQNLQTFLRMCENPELWICICPSCDALVEEAKRVNYEMVEIRKRFGNVKKRVIEEIQKSNAEQSEKVNLKVRKRKLPKRLITITDQSRSFVSTRNGRIVIYDYGHFTNPFIEGDKKANQLVKKNESEKSANDGENIIVKSEMESNDDLESCVDENEEVFFDLENDYLDSFEDSSDVDFELPSIDSNIGKKITSSGRQVKKATTSNSCTEIEAKYCNTCEVNFVGKMFDEHLKNLHNTVDNVEQDGQSKRQETVGTDSILTQEDLDMTTSEQNEENSKDPILQTAVPAVPNDVVKEAEGMFNENSNDTLLNEGLEVNTNIVITEFSCAKCSKKFYREDRFMEHKSLHETSPFHCYICLGVHKTERSLQSHLSKQHSSRRKKSNKDTHPVTIKRKKNAIGIKKMDARQNNARRKKGDKVKLPKLSESSTTVKEESVVQIKVELNRRKRTLFCPACKTFKFKAIEKLFAHWKSCKVILEDSSREETITCPTCESYNVSVSEELKFFEHLLICNENLKEGQKIPLTCRIFECNLCPSKMYFTFEGFLDHYLTHNKNIYKCTRCPKKCPVISHVHAHWARAHQDVLRKVKPLSRFVKDASVPEISWWCKICNQKFADEDSRLEHIHSAHESDVPEELYICGECPKAYSCKYELKLHKGTEHLSSNLNIFECDTCTGRFHTLNQLRNHRMKEHRLDLLVCDICGTECNSVSNLRSHMQLHQAVRKHPCQQCDQSFTNIPQLRNHTYQKHTSLDLKLNPLVCPYCNKALHNKYYLNKHIAGIHEGQFKVFCDLCPAGFIYNGELKVHLRKKHNIGEKRPYHCTIEGCDRKFVAPKKLREHINRHNGNPQYKCKFCPKEFYDSSHYLRHEKIHTNADSKPFVCEICAKRFPVRNYLYIHMKSHKNK